MWTRRAFIQAAGAGFATGLLPRAASALNDAELIFASAGKLPGGGFAAALVNEHGALIAQLPLPARGHDVTQCKVTGKLVVFARRPGTFAIVFNDNGDVLDTLTAVGGRHFYGHGLFSHDGKLLYATENAFETADGKIGIYDATDGFHRVGEFKSFGMDPHDIVLSRDGRVLCVANGGIETHPDFGRAELNIPTMQPSLAFIDAQTGDLLAMHEPPAALHQLSLHHMALGDSGTVWVGGQYKGDKSNPVPLIASASIDEPLRFADLPEDAARHLSFYVGAVASSPDGRQIVATSPVGNTALHLDTQSGATTLFGAQNVCGTDWAQTEFAYSTGQGELLTDAQSRVSVPFQFDNHLHTLA